MVIFLLQVSALISAHAMEPDQGFDDTMVEPRTLLEQLGQAETAAASIAWDALFTS